jgi:hypothetical protein
MERGIDLLLGGQRRARHGKQPAERKRRTERVPEHSPGPRTHRKRRLRMTISITRSAEYELTLTIRSMARDHLPREGHHR